MRITQQVVVNNLLQQIRDNSDKLAKIQTTLATNRGVRKPSDDPIKFFRAAHFKKVRKQNEQYLRNIDSANRWMDATLNSLENIDEIMMEAKVLAQDSLDVINDDEIRGNLVERAENLLNEAMHFVNRKHIGKSLFGGTATTASLAFSRKSIREISIYDGNNEKITRKISENYTVEINVTGQQLADTGLFRVLTGLRNGLEDKSSEAVQEWIDEVDSSRDRLLSLTTTTGSIKKNLLTLENQLKNANTDLTELTSREEDADMVETLVQFEAQQQVYQASLQSSSKIMSLSILDFLR